MTEIDLDLNLEIEIDHAMPKPLGKDFDINSETDLIIWETGIECPIDFVKISVRFALQRKSKCKISDQ